MKKLPVYPLLIAWFPLVYLWSVNVNYTNAWELPRPFSLTAATAIVVWLIAWPVFRDRHKAALWIAAAATCFFTYGIAMDVLRRHFMLGKHLIVMPAMFGLMTALTLWLFLTRRDLGKAAYPLNVLGACLIAVSLMSAARGYDWSAKPAAPETAPRPRPVAANPDDLPNIYYFIPDAYGRSDVLQHRYHYDNAGFLAALRDRGFYVADEALANYWVTLFSLSSSMTMDYHADLDRRYRGEGKRGKITLKRYLREAVAQGPVITRLREMGYTIVSFSSGFSVSETVDPDVYYAPAARITEFEQGAMDMTPLRWLALRWSRISPYKLHRRQIEYIFDHIQDAAELTGPKFVLVHVPVPHPPFVFGPDGEDVSPYDKPYSHQHNDGPLPYGKPNPDFIEKYRGQAIHTSARLLESIDTILKTEKRTPIILVQGDHGPMANRGIHREVYFPGERFPILSAYLLPPPGDPARLYPNISPVNSFRLIFNQYFNAGLPLLEDRAIGHSGAWVKDMTEQVKQEVAHILAGEPPLPPAPEMAGQDAAGDDEQESAASLEEME